MAFATMPRRPRDAYIYPPSDFPNRLPAGERGWWAGWENNCPPFSARTQLQISRPSDGHFFRLSVDTRLAGLFGDFLDLAQADGRYELRTAQEPSDDGHAQGGNGSFMCRAIRGSDPPKPSNHSSATAVDLWTLSNPRLTTGKFVSTIHPEVIELAAAALIYWGGWYYDADHAYVDAMHFEFMARPEDVDRARAALAAKAEEIRRRKAPSSE